MTTQICRDYFPTLINNRSLLHRLTTELIALRYDCRIAWYGFKQDPFRTTSQILRATTNRSRRILLAPNVITAWLIVLSIVFTVLLTERRFLLPGAADDLVADEASDPLFINLNGLEQKHDGDGIGRNGTGRVGFQKGSGEGSGNIKRRSTGGGGGGNNDPLPPQSGKLPPPSDIVAKIPRAAPLHPPTLPAAGIDIDPALWKDLKAPVYGDPRSTSTASSNGNGAEGGIGTNRGLGVGEGDGPGFGPGAKGNTGGDDNQRGCCGSSGSNGDNPLGGPRILRGIEVERRARVLSKPEPQYTEEARRNQITGTVMLRVVFSSLGQVEQIRAIQSLPYGLTERAIAAARQIKFVPATKGGSPVSVWMQLEYNFNLY